MATKGMLHLKGAIMCAVDVETTGLEPGFHEVWQVAILPLDSDIKPLRGVLPFYVNLKINYPERIEPRAIGNRQAFAQLQRRSLDPFDAADLLDTWFSRLKLPIYKKICPLAQNWPFDRAFIREWLGPENFEYLFSPHYRDTMVAAIWDSDLSNFRGEKILFTQYNLAFLCSRTEVHNDKPHDSLQDAIATAKVYRKMLLRSV